jgi:hypothetical protein
VLGRRQAEPIVIEHPDHGIRQILGTQCQVDESRPRDRSRIQDRIAAQPPDDRRCHIPRRATQAARQAQRLIRLVVGVFRPVDLGGDGPRLVTKGCDKGGLDAMTKLIGRINHGMTSRMNTAFFIRIDDAVHVDASPGAWLHAA